MKRSTMRRGFAMVTTAVLALGGAALSGPAFADDTAGAAPTGVASARVEALLASMTLDEKIGQTIWTHVYGDSANTTDPKDIEANQGVFGPDVKTGAQAVEKYSLGGILYFNWSRNIGSPADLSKLATLSNDLQAASLRTAKKIPLGITIDQEGGIVARMRYSGTDFAGNMALGATRSEELAYKQGEILGKELKAVGVNVDFAPDVDVNTNPANPVIGIRSMSSDPDVVARLGVAQVTGMQSQGVSATVKHFPGHGDTVTDSHLGLPKVTYDRATLNKHLKPFQASIDAGVDMVMTAHVIVDAIDPNMPGTLSKKVLTDLLRGEMGFKGVVTTDAIDMEGAWLAVMTPEEQAEWAKMKEEAKKPAADQDPTLMDKYHAKNHEISGRVAVTAMNAGSDIILNTYDVPAVIKAMKAAVEDGSLPMSRLDDAVRHILTWKEKRGLLDSYAPADLAKIPGTVRTADSLAVARSISDGSITQVCNGADNTQAVVPVKQSDRILVVGSSWANPEFLDKLLKDGGYSKTNFMQIADKDPTDAEIAAHVQAAKDADVIVYTGWKASASAAQKKEIAALQQTGVRMIFVATNTPYDVAYVSCANTAVLASYGNQVPNHEGIFDVITGKVAPLGKLPVDVPKADGALAAYAFGVGYVPAEKPNPEPSPKPEPTPAPNPQPVNPPSTPSKPSVPATEVKPTPPSAMPHTGAQVGAIVVAAIVLVAGGVALLVLRNRKR
ncbi:glycoside hydrolase family 3 N-terminal domain-containing protein [Trueperella sp. LYQ143]|uniref:glycoside hydrolase family 3 N-terminal domain-containing protein n=1 Tax=unclassified Trueperella TaxID=2630174 RepID=UPI003982DB65